MTKEISIKIEGEKENNKKREKRKYEKLVKTQILICVHHVMCTAVNNI